MCVPSEGANAELNDGEFLGGVFDLQILDIGAVKLERLAPGRAGDPRHLQVYGDEVGFPHVAPQLSQRGLEIRLGHILQRHVGSRRQGAEGTGGRGGSGMGPGKDPNQVIHSHALRLLLILGLRSSSFERKASVF